VVNYTAVRQSY